MFRKLKPVRVQTKESRGKRPPPEPERGLREAIDDAATGLTETFRRSARNLIDEVIRDIGYVRDMTEDESLLDFYHKIEEKMIAIRADIINGGVKGARRAFNASAALRGYRDSSPAQKHRMVERFAANFAMA